MSILFLLQKNTHIYLTSEIFHDNIIYLLYITTKEFHQYTISLYLKSFSWPK